MNRPGAYLGFLASPVVGALTRRIGQVVRFEGSPRELSDHLLKDIGVTPSEMLSVQRFRTDIRARRRHR